MRKLWDGFPPRYLGILTLSLSGAVSRLVPWIPFCLAYFLPLGVWSKVIILFCPAMWYTVVGPVRIRYGEILRELGRDQSIRLRPMDLLTTDPSWRRVFFDRVQLSFFFSLPFTLLSVLTALALLLTENAFAAMKIILGVSVWIASAVISVAASIPRLIMGEPFWLDAGVLGGCIALVVLFTAAFLLLLWGVFQTSGYRFGYKRMPKRGALRPLLKKNMILWIPTLLFGALLAAASHQELTLLLSNILSVTAVYGVKPQPLQIVLLVLMLVSYFALLPIRKWNTVRWVMDHS